MLSTRPQETDLKISLLNGSEIQVLGLDRPERVEGAPWDGCVLDEYGNMRPEVWTHHVRPALADRLGWADLIGVPEGRNHYWERYQEARAINSEDGEDSQWGAFTWTSAEILPPEEIAAMRRDMDELTFQQEAEASFVNFSGRAYYPFVEDSHCAKLSYRSEAPLVFCFDFNVDPGTASVLQEQLLPNGQEGTGVIGEVHIPVNSNTPAVCRRLMKDWGNHQGPVYVYGDATGGSRGSAKVSGSDWDLVRAEFRQADFAGGVHYRIDKANPSERSRVNAVNSRLKNTDGAVKLMVDPKKAPNVVKDFEGVRLLTGGSGEIDKKIDPKLTHLTDGIGYYIVKQFPVYGARRGQMGLTNR